MSSFDVAEILHDEFFGLAAALGFYLLEGHGVSFWDKGTKQFCFLFIIKPFLALILFSLASLYLILPSSTCHKSHSRD